MSAKFTPGPWRVVEHSWEEASVYGNEGEHICHIHISSRADEDTEQLYLTEMMANADIIAAAPDLLDALENVCTYIEQTANCNSDLAVASTARKAIKKALGESK